LEEFFVHQINGGKPVDWNVEGHIIVGYDTRLSSPILIGSLMEAITFSGSKYINLGITTTPQTHYVILVFNEYSKQYRENLPKFDYSAEELLKHYYEHFGGTFLKVFELLSEMGLHDKNKRKRTYVDCSNGVGGPHQEILTQDYFNKVFEVVVLNSRNTEFLNEECGSEYVQKERKVPRELLDLVEKQIPANESLDHASFMSYDGDADRAVSYRVTRGVQEADLFEGDKIGALYALFCQRILSKITDLQKKLHGVVDLKEDFTKWTIGAALTAYANGAAQKFYTDTLKVTLMIEPTGVKYLHRAAEKFDIGIYFESNGHGTVVYDHVKVHNLEEAVKIAQHALESHQDHKEDLKHLYQNVNLLYLFLVSANQGVGDAISNYIQVEVALAGLQMSSADWKAIYHDLYNAHSKIKVKNRTLIQVQYDQSRITSPIEIQEKIDEICKDYEMGRCFLRPSGTEDIVRCYVEAVNPEDGKAIQKRITEYLLSNKTVN